MHTPGYCTSCNSSLVNYKGRCLPACNGVTTITSQGKYCYDNCPVGSYDNGTQFCKPCKDPCESCSFMPTNCTSCKTGMLAAYGLCCNKCQPNQFLHGGICQNCTYPCTKCFTTATWCLACPSGRVLSSGNCIIDCPLRQFYHSSLKSCQPCGSTCETCHDSSTCLTCLDMLHVPINGICPFCNPPC